MNVCLHEIGEYETVADASRAETVMRFEHGNFGA
jgi:hypothetical protein